jgi:parallel beta-helix repeat protein
MRNNVIMNCTDVGIYLNKARDTTLYHNLIFNSSGIDVRFSTSSAAVRGNIISGAVRDRDGGTSMSSANITDANGGDFDAWFASPALADLTLKSAPALVDKGVVLPQVPTDFCGQARTTAPDLGPIEYASSTSTCAAVVKGKYDRF